MNPPGPSGRPPRDDQATDHPQYALEEVRVLAARWMIYATKRATKEGCRFLQIEEIELRGLLQELLVELAPDEWCFRQLENDEWADVYCVALDGMPPLWIKFKLESVGDRRIVRIITLHEYE